MYFIYLFTTLFNVGHTIVTRLIKTNLTKTNTDIIDKDFKIFSMQHKNSKSLYMIQFLFEFFNKTNSLTDIGRLFQSKLPRNCTEFIP